MEEGDRIAQLIIERIYTPEVLDVEVSACSSLVLYPLKYVPQDLDETLRGAGGFGSTGGHLALVTPSS